MGEGERIPSLYMRIVGSAVGHPGGDLRRQLNASVLGWRCQFRSHIMQMVINHGEGKVPREDNVSGKRMIIFIKILSVNKGYTVRF